MLGFRKKEETKAKEVDLNVDSSVSYTETNWIEDLNKSHEFFSDQIQNDVLINNQKDNSEFVNESIFSEYNELNENINLTEDIIIEEEKEEKIVKEKKKIQLSLRAKVHLTIYTLLVLFMFSMIIANAIIANANSLVLSADNEVYQIKEDTESLNKIVLPDGSTIQIKPNQRKKEINKNKFDQFCDVLEGK